MLSHLDAITETLRLLEELVSKSNAIQAQDDISVSGKIADLQPTSWIELTRTDAHVRIRRN